MSASRKPGYALITGASSGIGAAIAREYARRGKPLILTARRVDRLHALAVELSAQVPCEVIAADLSDPTAPRFLYDHTHSRGWFVDTLVNNAGYGVPGRLLSRSWKIHAEFLQVLMTAPAQLCHLQ